MYHLQLMLTKKCNQKCYYCTTATDESTEVDIDFLKYVLDCLPEESGVELTGGEIGLVENIDNVYRTVKDHKNVKHIKALSNGLLRLVGVDWIKDIEYWEHLIKDVRGFCVEKFYDLDLDQPHTYVIVTTQTTVQSLLDGWSYFEQKGLFRENFLYKLMNHKSNIGINKYFNDLCVFYTKLNGHEYFKRMLIYYYAKYGVQYPIKEQQKNLCGMYPPNVYVDFQTKQLGHCAMNIELTNKIQFTNENLTQMKNSYYKDDPCCEHCYSFDDGFRRNANNNRSYRQ